MVSSSLSTTAGTGAAAPRASASDAGASSSPAPRHPLSVSRRLGRLQFHLSGKFRVLQVADIQEGPTVSADTIRLLAAACDEARPDLVIFTGNQIKGYDSAFSATFRARRWRRAWEAAVRPDPEALERTRALVSGQAAQFLAPLIERGIPFAVTYGNHDFQCGLSTAELDRIYREFPGCLNPDPDQAAGSDGPADGTAAGGTVARSTMAGGLSPVPVPASGMGRQRAYAYGPGTFALPVWDVPDDDPLQHGVRVTRGIYEEQRGRLDGARPGEDAAIRSSRVDRPVLGLVCLDSGDYARGGGYGAPEPGALRWLARVPGALGVKSLVFQHFALPQMYGLLRHAPATSAGAIQGYGPHAQETFVLDESKVLPGSVLGEGISGPAHDAGEWQILTRPVPGIVAFAGDGSDEALTATMAAADKEAAKTARNGVNGFIGVLSGHDHRNGFAGLQGGLLLAATPTSGFGSYGPPASRRAIRLVEFDARHPWHPRTKLLTFGDLVGGRSSRAVYTFASAHVPVNLGQARDVARRPRNLAGLAAFIAALAGVGAGLRRVFTHRGRRL